jgi:hypothetical protein
MLPEQGVTPAVNRATRQGDKLVAQAEAARRAPALQDQLTGYVTTRSASRDTIAAVTASIVANGKRNTSRPFGGGSARLRWPSCLSPSSLFSRAKPLS